MVRDFLVRLVWVSPLFGLAAWLAFKMGGATGFAAIVYFLGAVLCLLIALFSLAPKVLGMFTGTDAILFPGLRFRKPQAMLGPAEKLEREGRFEEALVKFQAVSRTHPEEVRGWEAQIHILLYELHDASRAHDVMDRAAKAPLNAEEKAHLASMLKSLEREASRPPPGAPIHFVPGRPADPPPAP